MDDLISRQSVLNIFLYFNESERLETIKMLPSAQTELITKIQNGIKATNADDVYSCGMRNGMRWCISLIDDKDPLYENCPSIQPEKRTETHNACLDAISRQAAIDALGGEPIPYTEYEQGLHDKWIDVKENIEALPSAQPEGYVRIPKTGIDDLSDGFHTFRQLYYQRMMLFATIVKQNREKAWKSMRHEDGELCFGGDWFIVGIDTPEGTYTYHYEANYYSMFDCKELERARHWDGHTEKDVTRLLSLPSTQPEIIRCFECKHGSPNGKYGCKLYHFRLYETHEMNADDYCSRAERKEE